ncbi:DinB family protein [Thermanaerothrix sp. 4228-RoL]|uniref:DinB family protein n=1 Tax=Thermanaerothrix solaris TaxID=3058434 RepID=A0ABU3NQ54_9CHLR|nr:DinB family protein [Thermanaerothrix sp. 4228-RoL]MDT8898172.1 DinB family protein [Thermanaerothrix sp. 4228-RoL]
MILYVGVENGTEGRSLAWALEHPGCFAYGRDATEALIAIVPAYVAYAAWVNRHAQPSWLPEGGDVDVRLVEVWEVYHLNDRYERTTSGGYEVNAWFQHDWKPLTRLEVRRGMQMLAWSRADLLALVQGLDAATLDRTYPGERWSIRGILEHVAGAEWWYLDRLGLAGMPRAALPADVFERLTMVRQRLEAVLPQLEGEERVIGRQGELWSPRKLLRRALWHERDHYDHIRRLLGLI